MLFIEILLKGIDVFKTSRLSRGAQFSVMIFAIFFLDEGVYVNTNGELVRHAVLQWGETPYAIGKFLI